MKATFLSSLAAAVLLSASAMAQVKPLTIGDTAPNFKPVGWVNGKAIPKFEKGNIYVVEFWATWCGPCKQSMPHLSDLADKFKGKVNFVGVNTWDRNEPGEKDPENKSHGERISKYVAENSKTIRYTVALDDSKDTISTEWMRAAGQNGIPTAFIVNKEGQVAWIGHPMEMEKPLEEVVKGTYDMMAFKASFEAEIAAEKEQARIQGEIMAAAKAGDSEKFESLIDSLPGNKANAIANAISGATSANPEFALKEIEKYVGKVEGLDPEDWCSLLSYVVRSTKSEDTRTKALNISEGCAEKTATEMKAVGYAYHARALAWAGKKDDAQKYIDKARAAVSTFEPADARPNVTKFVDSIQAIIDKMN